MLDRGAALRAVADPLVPPAVLADVATAYPDLRPAVAAHPVAYPALLDWLVAVGGPQVAGIVAQRRLGPGPTVPPGYGPPPVGNGVPPNWATTQAYPGGYSVPPWGAPPRSSVWHAFESMTGGEGQTIVRFRDLFRDTFKKHTAVDRDALIYSGTGSADHRPRLPWLYMRVFALLFGSFCVLWLCYALFRNSATNLVPGVIFLGALAVPATAMIFFWEFDQSRVLSLLDLLQTFFLGAAFSLFLTFLIDVATYQMIPEYPGVTTAFAEAIAVGVAEETAKMVVVFALVRRLRGALVSNGLLVGAIVGTGFAVFETMGYGLQAWTDGSMEWTLFVRGVLSVGGHVAWAAISGAAIMLAQRPGVQRAGVNTMAWSRFFALFAVPVVLHAAWDFIAFTVDDQMVAYTLMAGLVVIAWIFIVRLINAGLRQYASLIGSPIVG